MEAGVIILVRHGEAGHHVEDLTGGWTDSALTAAGREQIEQVADILAAFCQKRPLRLLSSDLIRAEQSARIIAGQLSLDVELHPFLREKNNGQAAGKTSKEAEWLRLPRQAPEPDNRKYPGGETRREFFSRVAAGLSELPLTSGDFLLVAHKGTIQNILFWWLGLTIDQVCQMAVSFNIRAASLSLLRINKWLEREIALLNYCGPRLK
jgi:probable phosphoglycerate mutase